MAKTKAVNGKDLPASSFLVVGDPADTDTWHLPVKDASGKPDHGLMGAAYAALTSNHRGRSYSGPDKAKALARLKALYRSEKMPLPGGNGKMAESEPIALADVAEFAMDDDEVGGDAEHGTVIRTGLIFKAGDYRPKRDFAMTPDELKAVAEAFSDPVDLELEHINSNGVKTLLDGKLGKLTAIWTSDDGAELFGDVDVPRWLDRLWSEAGRKVSTVWETAADGTAALVRLGLCLNPVVKDAQLFAEYAAFAGQRHSASDMADLQMIHDIALKQGATCPMPPPLSPSSQSSQTSQHQGPRFAASTDDDRPPNGDGHMADDNKTQTVTAAQFAEMQTAMAEMKQAFESQIGDLKTANTTLADQNKTLMANYATERQKRIQSEAVAFAEAQITAGKAYPAERERLVMRYVLAVEDDANHGPVVFGDGEGQQTSRLDLLQKEFADKQTHGLTEEQVKVINKSGLTQVFGLANPQQTPGAQERDEDAAAPQSELDEMLGMTNLGKLVIAGKKSNGAS